MKIDLSGKIALVTGGAKGIGRSTSLQLSEAGATVIINYQKSKDQAEEIRLEISKRGGTVDVIKADISIPPQVEALFEHIRNRYQRLDILVNNAGIIKDNLLLAMEISDWDKVHDVNLRGPFLCTRLAAEMMMFHHCGKIINIASVVAIRGGRGQSNYASSKGGLVAFTRACAVELGGKGIQVNAVLPGVIDTQMSKRARKRDGEKIIQRIPAARYGETDDVANLVVFLASDKADYITGQGICVDGGLGIA